MKLKYDKTGEYGKLVFCKDDDRYAFYIEATGCKMYYHSFRQMVEAGWEVCKEPKEPLIKDKNIRKAVKAWAYVNGVKTATYDELPYDRSLNTFFFEDDEKENAIIQFYGWIPTLKEGETHTITELCGESDNEN